MKTRFVTLNQDSVLRKFIKLSTVLLSLVVFGTISYAAELLDDLPEVRMLIRSDIPCGFRSADIYQTLDESIERFEERYQVRVQLSSIPSSIYEEKLLVALNSKLPPHVIWADAAAVPLLVRLGLIIPLQKKTEGDAEVLTDDTVEMPYDLFTYKNNLYGLALGYEGELLRNAYMITRGAEKDDSDAIALQLIEHLKLEIPLSGLPDLVIDRVEISHKKENRLATRKRERKSRYARATAFIKNLGEETAERTSVSFQFGRQQQSRDIRNLAVGKVRTVKFKFLMDEYLPEPLIVRVDPYDLIDEDNEQNNSVRETITDQLPWPGPVSFPPTPAIIGTPFVIESEAYTTSVRGMGPKVAFDGQNYLVVWARQTPLTQTGYNHELRAARIQPDGQILDPGGFVIASGPEKYDSFEVAFDGDNTFLVAWARNLLYFDPLAAPVSVIEGVRVTSSGLINQPSPILIDNSTAPAGSNRIGHSYPDVFFDGTDFQVVYRSDVQWTDDLIDITAAQSGIYMKSVAPLSGNVGVRQTLVTFGSNVVGFGSHQVAFSQEGKKGLLIFTGLTSHDSLTGDYAVWSRWFTLSGGLFLSTLEAVETSPAFHPYDNPVVAGVEPDFVAVWEAVWQPLVPPPLRVAELQSAQGMSLPGTVAGSVVPVARIIQACDDRFPRIAFNGSRFTVVDQHKHGCHTYLGAVGVDPDGTAGMYTYFDFGGEPDLVGHVDIAFGPVNGLVVFEHLNQPSTYNGPDSSEGIWGLFLNNGSTSPP